MISRNKWSIMDDRPLMKGVQISATNQLAIKFLFYIKRISVYIICTHYRWVYIKVSGSVGIFSMALPFINEWLAGTIGIYVVYCIRYCG